MSGPSIHAQLCAALSQHNLKGGNMRGAAFACRAGVNARQIANAASARPVATVPFLRICIAFGFDPLPQIPHLPPVEPRDFDHERFALGFKIGRCLKGQSEREAAAAIDVSPSTVSRLERGHLMSIGVILRACVFLESHPFGWLRVPSVPRETFHVPIKQTTEAVTA